MLRKTALILGLFALTACTTEPVRNLENNSFGAPEKATLKQIEFAIFLAAKRERWQLRRIKPGHIEATYSLRQHTAVVDIKYDKNNFSIEYKDSINLKFDGKEISKHYALWIEKLKWKIRRYASSINERQESVGTPTEPLSKHGSGSGFFVSRSGHILTNAHVVKDCFEVHVTQRGKARVLGKDAKSDLALLKIERGGPGIAKLRNGSGVRLGEDVVATGYPLQGLLGVGLNVSTGTVSNLSGLGGNSQEIQMTAPVQRGSSGGPLLDRSGNVVGVVVAKLNAIAVARVTKDIPQNVNFAINAWTVRPFLERYRVRYETASSGKKLQVADVAEAARAFTVPIECWR